MSSCCVVGCQNRRSTGSNLKFYRIPAATARQKKRRQLWLNAIKRADWTEAIIKNARVCSAHFISGEASMDKDSPDFVPSVFSYKRQSDRLVEKLERLERERLTVEQEAPCHADDDPMTPEKPVEEAEPVVPQAAYSALSEKYDQLNTEYVNLRKDFYQLQEENERLKEELQQSRFSFPTIKNNPAHFLFLTGLTSVLFS